MNFGYNTYKNFLKVFVKMLKDKAKDGLVSIALYGSVARGKARAESDIDLLILYDRRKVDLDKVYLKTIIKAKQTKEYKELWENKIYASVSPYIVTVEELKENPLILLDIIDEGIILYEKGKRFRELLNKFKQKIRQLGSRKVYLPDGTYYWELKPDWKPGEVIEIKL